jgi:hypothetical protein
MHTPSSELNLTPCIHVSGYQKFDHAASIFTVIVLKTSTFLTVPFPFRDGHNILVLERNHFLFSVSFRSVEVPSPLSLLSEQSDHFYAAYLHNLTKTSPQPLSCEDQGSIVFWNIDVHLQYHMVSQPRRPYSEQSPLWIPQNTRILCFNIEF